MIGAGLFGRTVFIPPDGADNFTEVSLFFGASPQGLHGFFVGVLCWAFFAVDLDKPRIELWIISETPRRIILNCEFGIELEI